MSRRCDAGVQMGFLLRLFVQQGGSLQPLKWQYPEIVFVNPEYVGLLWSKQFLHISSSNFLHVSTIGCAEIWQCI